MDKLIERLSADAGSSNVNNPKELVSTWNVLMTKIENIPESEFIKFMEEVVEKIKITDYVFSGGVRPSMRRKKLFSTLTGEQVKLLIGITHVRGHQIGKYATRAGGNDALSAELSKLVGDASIKHRVNNRTVGSNSVVAVKIALADFFVAFYKRAHKGKNATFGDKTYGGECPPMYQYLGSLAAMYDPREEKEKMAIWATYCKWYEDFQDWYIQVRTDAAKARGQKQTNATEEVRNNAKNYSRQFYPVTLSSYSLEQRRNWYNGVYTKEVQDGNLGDRGGDVLEHIAAVLKTSKDVIMAATRPGQNN